MSKFFDETQKARQWAPQVPETVRLDVVSVIDAIKQSDNVAPPLAPPFAPQLIETAPVEAPVAEAERPFKGPIKTGQGDNILPAPAVEAYGSLRTRVMKLQA
jgi:hypothetical protein